MDDNFEQCLSLIKASGLEFKPYPKTGLINVTDVDGVIQSYYTTTRTAIFRDGNNRFKSQKHTEYNMALQRFIDLCNGTEDIIETFFD